jgi:O-methyltransferase
MRIMFSRWRLNLFFDGPRFFFLNFHYIRKFTKWTIKNGQIEYNDFPSKWWNDKRLDLFSWVFEKENLSSAVINYLEFGVHKGDSLRWFLAHNSNSESRFYGFDTFSGLPESWGSFEKGTFDTGETFPSIDDNRISFKKGLFQDTLPPFVKELDNCRRNVIMLDADLYSSTLFVLTTLAPLLKKEDIVFFDEFACPTHEFKAFIDFTQSYYIDLKLIGAKNNYYYAAFKVI